MRSDRWMQEKLEKARKRPSFNFEKAILDFTSHVCEQMENQNITRAELAKRLNKKPAYITRVLNGSCNPTVKTMVSFAMALDSEFKLDLVSKAKESIEFVTNTGQGYKLHFDIQKRYFENFTWMNKTSNWSTRIISRESASEMENIGVADEKKSQEEKYEKVA